MNGNTAPTAQPSATAAEITLLGPFLGHVTTSSIKIWLHLERSLETVWVSVHPQTKDAQPVRTAALNFVEERLFTDCVEVPGLEPDTLYFYNLWTNPACSIPLPLDGLQSDDLYFHTLSENPDAQIDFVVMSCHNPRVAHKDGFEGHAVWADLPQIISRHSNCNVRFALLVGDQIYADDWKDEILRQRTHEERLRVYLQVYRAYWSNIYYRRVLCRLPAVMMWDDHDIVDGWGSEETSFEGTSDVIRQDWQGLFEAAFGSFSLMQASRNPAPLATVAREGLDFAFRAGRWGFVFLDLRTNRNFRKKQLRTGAQAELIRDWVAANREGMRGLFVISPVVFSHGSPLLEDFTVKAWPFVMKTIDWFASRTRWGKGLQTKFMKSLGDIRDDIRDSWSCPDNAETTDEMLDYLFGLQNDTASPLSVVVLSGDIHTSGYANIYSSDPAHKERATISHITSSSISYTPFNWLLEAIYRFASKTVALGKKGSYSSQVSHHFTSRSVAVLSLRPMKAEDDFQLKVKYYLEGYPEPQILLFDLERTSHREDISWVAQDKLSAPGYAPTAPVNVDALLQERARTSTKVELNWQESIVDLMKLFGLDSSLESRKRVARQWGYNGALDGSAEMNIFLHREMMKRFIAAGGAVPAELTDSAPPQQALP